MQLRFVAVGSSGLILAALACSTQDDAVPEGAGASSSASGGTSSSSSGGAEGGASSSSTSSSSTSSSGEPPDADAPDAEPDGSARAPSKCAGSTMKVCDGFESAAVDAAIWSSVIQKNATVTLDGQHVMRGAKALHVHTGTSGADTAGTNGGVRTTKGFPFPNDDVWGRVFVYMKGTSPDAHTNLVEAVGTLPDGEASHVRLGVTTNHVLSGNYIPGDYADRSKTVMPLDAWKCFEWHWDGANDAYHVYLEGAELVDMAILGDHAPKWTVPAFAYLELGLHLYHDLPNAPTLDVWYDELALDTKRVGCQN